MYYIKHIWYAHMLGFLSHINKDRVNYFLNRKKDWGSWYQKQLE